MKLLARALHHQPALHISPVWRRIFRYVSDPCESLESNLICRAGQTQQSPAPIGEANDISDTRVTWAIESVEKTVVSFQVFQPRALKHYL